MVYGAGPAGSLVSSPVAWTELALARLLGEVREHEDAFQVRTPDNWGYYHGNYLFLPSPPEASALPRWVERARALFSGDPIEHVCLCWDRGELSPEALERARSMGFAVETGVSMLLQEPPPASAAPFTVRALTEEDWEASVALNRQADPDEAQSGEGYRQFKERTREGWKRLQRQGAATWYGAFQGARLLGQCGLVDAGALGRFQSVETHPEARRQGVCTALVAAVCRIALPRHPGGLALSADPEGPAIGLYRRLGFVEVDRVQSLTLGGEASPSSAASPRGAP